MPNTTEILSGLQEKYRKIRFCVLFVLVLLVAAIVFIFVNRIITFILLGCALLFYYFYIRSQQKVYSDTITNANLSCTIAKMIGADEIFEKSGSSITKSTLDYAAMMPVKDAKGSPLLCWGMSGTLNGYPVSLCDATIAQDFELKEKGRKRVHFNAGTWVHMELPEETESRWCLIDESAVPTPIRMDYFSHKMNMQTASVGNDIVGKRCVLYQPADKERQLSANLLHEVQKLIDYTPGYLAISVKGKSIDFFIRGRFLSRPVTMSKAPTKELLEFDPFPELKYLVRIAREV